MQLWRADFYVASGRLYLAIIAITDWEFYPRYLIGKHFESLGNNCRHSSSLVNPGRLTSIQDEIPVKRWNGLHDPREGVC